MSDDGAGPRVGAVIEGVLGRDSGTGGQDDTERQADAEGHADDADFTPASLESLHRVLEGLRHLS